MTSSGLWDQLIRMIIDSRAGVVLDEAALAEATTRDGDVHLITLLGRELCSTFICANSIPIEVWTLKLQMRTNNEKLNAWISMCNGKLPAGVCCAYRISLTDDLTNKDLTATIQTHQFPPTRLEGTMFKLLVSVKWLKKEEIPAFLSCHHGKGIESIVQSSTCRIPKPALDTATVEPNVRKEEKLRRPTAILLSEEVVDESEMDQLPEFFSETAASSSPPTSPRREQMPRRSALAARSGGINIFNRSTGFPLNSSPAPSKNGRTVAETRIMTFRKIHYSGGDDSGSDNEGSVTSPCKSAPAGTGLLCNFEESALNGRLDPVLKLDGFTLQIAASGSFCSPHHSLPVSTYTFDVSEDATPSPFMGTCNLDSLGKRGYHIPRKGTLQATLFNPQGTVVKLFVIKFDLSDMPCSAQTFIRQRTFFMPKECERVDVKRSWLRYLIHLRLATDRWGKLYVHTDIRMLFSTKSELDSLNIVEIGKTVRAKEPTEAFQLKSYTEMPQRPKYSPRK